MDEIEIRTVEEEPSAQDFVSLIMDYNLKSPTSLKIKPARRELSSSSSPETENSINSAGSSSSSSPTATTITTEPVEPVQGPQQPQPTTVPDRNVINRRVLSFAEERPISTEALMSTPNRHSMSNIPLKRVPSQMDDDDDLNYVDLKKGSLTPIPNSQRSDLLSLFSTPNIDTPSQTPSTSTQPLHTPAAEIIPPILSLNRVLGTVTKQVKTEDSVSDTKIVSNSDDEKTLEELKIDAMIKGRKEEESMLVTHNCLLGFLAFIISFPLAIFDVYLSYSPHSDKFPFLTITIARFFKEIIHPIAISSAKYWGLSQKRQDYFNIIFLTMPIATCFLILFCLAVYLLSSCSFESKWKRKCRENYKKILVRINAIENQNCTN